MRTGERGDDDERGSARRAAESAERDGEVTEGDSEDRDVERAVRRWARERAEESERGDDEGEGGRTDVGRVADELTERLREARSGRDADDDTVSTDQEAGSGEELAQLVDRATRSGEDDEEADGRGEDTRRLVQEFEDARGGEEADEDSGREQGSAER